MWWGNRSIPVAPVTQPFSGDPRPCLTRCQGPPSSRRSSMMRVVLTKSVRCNTLIISGNFSFHRSCPTWSVCWKSRRISIRGSDQDFRTRVKDEWLKVRGSGQKHLKQWGCRYVLYHHNQYADVQVEPSKQTREQRTGIPLTATVRVDFTMPQLI